MKTPQTEFWSNDFGKEYTERNGISHTQWNEFYIKSFGITKLEMNAKLISDLPRDIKILEVGCNTGLQLEGLQKQGFTNLWGLDLQWGAIQIARQVLPEVNLIQASGFDIPFKDGFFDLVCTNGVLIHISPNDLKVIMSEIYRCSNKYIMGFEYFAPEITDIVYRGNTGFLWKADYCKIYREYFPDLKLIKDNKYPYIIDTEKGNVDAMFLLEK